MSDELLQQLAVQMGISLNWTDQTGTLNSVDPATLRAVLSSMSVPCYSDNDIRNSLSTLETGLAKPSGIRFMTARSDQPIIIPYSLPVGTTLEVKFENGSVKAFSTIEGQEGTTTLPAINVPGYHTINLGELEYTIATAPPKFISIPDTIKAHALQTNTVVPYSSFGIGCQIYGLKRHNDCGIGDFGGVAALAKSAAVFGACAIGISPVHALYSAFPDHFSPYSPSSRLTYNPLHADASCVFSNELIQDCINHLGIGDELTRFESLSLIDWPASTDAKLKLFRELYRRFKALIPGLESLWSEFESYVKHVPDITKNHAVFEAVLAHLYSQNSFYGNWHNWPNEYKQLQSKGIADFTIEHSQEVEFHLFLQWLVSRSYADCQRSCKEAGMAIGLVADLAIGMDSCGSHAWSQQGDILNGLSIGAPPDYYNSEGQSWGLTTFSPRGLLATGFQPYIDTLRASLRHVGGIRMDHIMGLRRLWLVPEGAKATQGAYVSFPSENMFRILALEAYRHQAVVIGEDLGTLPDGFREDLSVHSIAGMRVLRFEKEGDTYKPPQTWDADSVAMTTTHDLVPTAGWWKGIDIVDNDQVHAAHEARAWDRGILWSAFEKAGIVTGERPEPWNANPVVKAAIQYAAQTPCALKLISLEDVVGSEDQPNVPGTTKSHPNWRHRMQGDASTLLENDNVKERLSVFKVRSAVT